MEITKVLKPFIRRGCLLSSGPAGGAAAVTRSDTHTQRERETHTHTHTHRQKRERDTYTLTDRRERAACLRSCYSSESDIITQNDRSAPRRVSSVVFSSLFTAEDHEYVQQTIEQQRHRHTLKELKTTQTPLETSATDQVRLT